MKKLSIAAVSLAASLVLTAHAQESPTALRALAHDYYAWRDAAYPVATSGAGDHRLMSASPTTRCPRCSNAAST